jgi:hypothetical protein
MNVVENSIFKITKLVFVHVHFVHKQIALHNYQPLLNKTFFWKWFTSVCLRYEICERLKLHTFLQQTLFIVEPTVLLSHFQNVSKFL